MIYLDLNAGDKIRLPSTTEINGKTYRLIPYESQKSKQLKGFHAIQSDLSQIKHSITTYLEDSSHDFEHLRALVITYRKLWKETGSRFVKLEIQRNLKQASEDLLNSHHLLIQLGDKYIAHPDETDYDQNSTFLIVDEEKAVGVCCLRMALLNFDRNQYLIWLELIKFLENHLSLLIDEKKKAVIDEYNGSLLKKIQPNQRF